MTMKQIMQPVAAAEDCFTNRFAKEPHDDTASFQQFHGQQRLRP